MELLGGIYPPFKIKVISFTFHWLLCFENVMFAPLNLMILRDKTGKKRSKMKRIPVQEDGKNLNPTILELLKLNKLWMSILWDSKYIVIATFRGDLLLFSAIVDTHYMVWSHLRISLLPLYYPIKILYDSVSVIQFSTVFSSPKSFTMSFITLLHNKLPYSHNLSIKLTLCLFALCMALGSSPKNDSPKSQLCNHSLSLSSRPRVLPFS